MPIREADVIADLNDLIQLDHDAVAAYTLALDTVRSDAFRERLATFRADHKRHIDELATLVRARGGTAVELPHLPTGVFKLAVQAAGAVAGDASVLLAFKANEGQVRDKYRRAAEKEFSPEIADVVRRAAADEDTHYEWVSSVLIALGHGPRTVQGRAEELFESAHKTVADAVENVERAAMATVDRLRHRDSAGS